MFIQTGAQMCSRRHTQTHAAGGEMGTVEPYHCDSYYDGWLYHLREEIPLSPHLCLLRSDYSPSHRLAVDFSVLGSKGDILKVAEENKTIKHMSTLTFSNGDKANNSKKGITFLFLV